MSTLLSSKKVYISLEDAVRAIREVPDGNWGNARYVSAVTAVRAADVVERHRWISVKERMPEDGKNVLAYEGGGFYFLDWCCDGDWVVASESTAVVTHWMPLPEPPEGQK